MWISTFLALTFLILALAYVLIKITAAMCGEFVLMGMDVMLMIAHTFQCDLALSHDQDHECKSEDKCALCTSMGLTFPHPLGQHCQVVGRGSVREDRTHSSVPSTSSFTDRKADF